MDHRLIQPASRDQIVAIIRQRAERANRDLQPHLGQVVHIFSSLLVTVLFLSVGTLFPNFLRDVHLGAGML
jgi:hypothetical protein